jgi:maltodextrin utilization protein YvdJ
MNIGILLFDSINTSWDITIIVKVLMVQSILRFHPSIYVSKHTTTYYATLDLVPIHIKFDNRETYPMEYLMY